MKKRVGDRNTGTKSRANVLKVMAALLIASAIMRAGDQIGTAVAQPVLDVADAGVDRPDRVLGMPLDDQSLPQLLELFQAREQELLEAERRATRREEALALSATSIAQQLEELALAEEKLANTLAMTDTAAEADLERLATVYENMKPRDTAALFSEMAPGFAAGFLGLMRPEAAAAIMTELEPDTAHLISVMLAGRNALAPRRQ